MPADSTHCTPQAYQFCKENSIILLTIPSHTPHRFQPLDASFHGSLKTAFNSECCKYLRNQLHERITSFEDAELFNNALVGATTLEKPINGFEVTGICPNNTDVFTDEDIEPVCQCQCQ